MAAPEPRPFVSSGRLPSSATITDLLERTHERFAHLNDGVVSQVYPALAAASPDLFGLAVVGIEGNQHTAGDSSAAFALMSVAKPFTLALAIEDHGLDDVLDRVGIEATGLPFNSVEALQRHHSGRTNPMVNSGAILTASLIKGANHAEKWERIRRTLSAFAGHDLHLDAAVFDSARTTNHRNRELSETLATLGVLEGTADDALDLYTRQSCLRVTALDLAVMGATLADGGVNPVTGARVIDAETGRAVLVAMTVAGLYEGSGKWLMDVGLPGKSGIGGGIVTVSPGKGALGTYSPPLDAAGNSVRGIAAAHHLSRAAGLDMFASRPFNVRGGEGGPLPT